MVQLPRCLIVNCPNCQAEMFSLRTCQSCSNLYCIECQPHWDHARQFCQHCQEADSIIRLGEGQYSQRLREKFSAPIKVDARLDLRLPWSAMRMAKGGVVNADHGMVARFKDESASQYAVKAANLHQPMSVLLASIHERIRTGRPIFTGSEQDCADWERIKELLK